MTEADETATDETGNRTAPHPTRRTLLNPQPPHGSSFRLWASALPPLRPHVQLRRHVRWRSSEAVSGREPLGGDGGLGLTGVLVRWRLHYGRGPMYTLLTSNVE